MKVNYNFLVLLKLLILLLIVIGGSYYYAKLIAAYPNSVKGEELNQYLMEFLPSSLIVMALYMVRIFFKLNRFIFLVFAFFELYFIWNLGFKHPFVGFLLFIENILCFSILLNQVDFGKGVEFDQNNFTKIIGKIQTYIKPPPDFK